MAVLDEWLKVLRNVQYGDGITIVTDCAIGTGTTPVTGADTALETEVIRGTATLGKVSDTIISYVTTFSTAQANGSTITEAGAVNAGTGGVFATRKVFPGFEKTVQYELRISIFVDQENNI